jgi:Rps23 Pro-64 3,4-dihydroxylase Tpa1-like proline 4-hydroxylase
MDAAPFRLNPKLDREQLAQAYRAHARLRIPNFLADGGAEHLLAALEADQAWKLILNQGERVIEIDRPTQAAMHPEQKAQLARALNAGARQGFQYCYETIKAPHADADRATDPTPLNAFARFLSSDGVLDLLRSVTGADDISFADAQATAYGPGHFLTPHDDLAPKQQRRVAYVLNLTPQWNVEWGGLLTFDDDTTRTAEAFIPAFNTLNLFAVPQQHSVSFVAPFAPRRRYSVTGWLRTGTPP